MTTPLINGLITTPLINGLINGLIGAPPGGSSPRLWVLASWSDADIGEAGTVQDSPATVHDSPAHALGGGERQA